MVQMRSVASFVKVGIVLSHRHQRQPRLTWMSSSNPISRRSKNSTIRKAVSKVDVLIKNITVDRVITTKRRNTTRHHRPTTGLQPASAQVSTIILTQTREATLQRLMSDCNSAGSLALRLQQVSSDCLAISPTSACRLIQLIARSLRIGAGAR